MPEKSRNAASTAQQGVGATTATQETVPHQSPPRSRCAKREPLQNQCEATSDSRLSCRNTWGEQVIAARSECGSQGEYSGAMVQIYQNCSGYDQVYIGGPDYGTTWYYDMTTLRLAGIFDEGPAGWVCYGELPEREQDCRPIATCKVRGKR
jgi:hypothetical protein